MRLAHGWTLETPRACAALARDFIRPPVRAVPPAMARRIGHCRVALVGEMPDAASRWRETPAGWDLDIATAGVDGHEAAMELLLCLGQILWLALSDAERAEWWTLLRVELSEASAGEIDELAWQEKRRLLANRAAARSPGRLERWAAAAFAGTAAQYVHAMWHDVTVHTGPEHLPAPQLRRRLELLARWFPPRPGYRLFPA